jgi:CBS domain-containing protein
MITVKRLLEKKGSEIWSIAPHAMVYEALSLMAEKNIGAVLVIDGGVLVGILSERDYESRPDTRRMHGPDDQEAYPPSARLIR